jgi:hypothetical protein
LFKNLKNNIGTKTNWREKMSIEQTGNYALIGGVLIAILTGIAQNVFGGLDQAISPWIGLALVVLGLVVGFLNIKDENTVPFLIASIALVVTAIPGAWAARLTTIDQLTKTFGFGLGSMLQIIVFNIAMFAAPAALVVALKTVYSTASAEK